MIINYSKLNSISINYDLIPNFTDFLKVNCNNINIIQATGTATSESKPIPNIFKLVLKDPDAWYNTIKFDIIFAYDNNNGNAYRPKIMFTLDNDKSKSKQIKLFIDAEKTVLNHLNNIYDIEEFIKDDFYKELKIDTVYGFISFLKEAIRFYVSPASKGNTLDITW